MLAKNFDAKSVEPKWRKAWEAQGLGAADPKQVRKPIPL